MSKTIYFFISLTFLIPTWGFAENYIAGQDYVVIKNGETTPSSGVISITEFFSYGCPWCYRLEPTLEKWVASQGDKVSLQKIPVIFNKDWEYYAKAFYAAQAVSLQEELSPVLFKAILKDKQPLNNDKAMIQFLTANGVDHDIAESAFHNSSSIDLEISNSKRMMARYKVGAVPAVLVGERYKTDLQMAKSEKRLLAILDYLVKKSQENNKAGPTTE